MYKSRTFVNYTVFLIIFIVLTVSLLVSNMLYAQKETKETPAVETQGEYAVQLVKAMGWDTQLSPTSTTEEYINLLVKMGIEPADGFQPGKLITKEDRILLLSKALDTEKGGFPGVPKNIYGDKAVITEISGDVKVKLIGSDQWIKAEVGMKLSENDSIKTGTGSVVHLNVGIAGKVKIKENTELLLKSLSYEADKNKQTVCLYLALGELLIDARGISEGSTFDTVTPTTTVGVRGTIYSVKVTGTTTIVR